MSSILITTEKLASQLTDPNLRILDATAFLDPRADRSHGYEPRSGYSHWEGEHLLHSQHIDLTREFSDTNKPLPFTMPSLEEFCCRMEAKGVTDENTVVIYSATSVMWATRLWWMFQSVGFQNCAVLDGGLLKWKKEGRPATTVKEAFPPGKLSCHPIPSFWAKKEDLKKTLNDSENTCVIDALSPKDYAGARAHYGRPGHIPGSRNIFYHHLIDETTGTFLPVEKLKKLFAPSGALLKERIICYCGGGIASTINAVALRLCGHKKVAVYDGSMLDWAADKSLPLTLGASP